MRGVHGRDAPCVRLDLAHGIAVEPAQVMHAVGPSAIQQATQPRHLVRPSGDDQLAALLVDQAPLRAVLAQLAATAHAQLRLL